VSVVAGEEEAGESPRVAVTQVGRGVVFVSTAETWWSEGFCGDVYRMCDLCVGGKLEDEAISPAVRAGQSARVSRG